MVLTKIIHGGQTGADQAAGDCAIDYDIKTGGTAAKGWLTENGPDLRLRDVYGLIESSRPGYPVRTIMNVCNADGTVLFGDMNSPGSRLAIKTAREQDKPLIMNPTPEDLAAWIENRGIRKLNVGGNRASTNPTVYRLTYDTLAKAIECLRLPVVDGDRNQL